MKKLISGFGIIILQFFATYGQNLHIDVTGESLSNSDFTYDNLYVNENNFYCLRKGKLGVQIVQLNSNNLSIEKELLLLDPVEKKETRSELLRFKDGEFYFITVKYDKKTKVNRSHLKIIDQSLNIKAEFDLPEFVQTAKSNDFRVIFNKINDSNIMIVMIEDGSEMTKDIDRAVFYIFDSNMELVKQTEITSKSFFDFYYGYFVSSDKIIYEYSETVYKGNYYYYVRAWAIINLTTGEHKKMGFMLGEDFKAKKFSIREGKGELKAYGSFSSSDEKYTLGAMEATFDEETDNWVNINAAPFPEGLSEILSQNNSQEFAGYYPELSAITKNGNRLFFYNGRYNIDKSVAKKMKLTDGESSIILTTIQLVTSKMDVIFEKIISRYDSPYTKLLFEPFYMEDVGKIFFITRDVNNAVYEKKRMTNLTTSIVEDDMEYRLYLIDTENKDAEITYTVLDNSLNDKLGMSNDTFEYSLSYLGGGRFLVENSTPMIISIN